MTIGERYKLTTTKIGQFQQSMSSLQAGWAVWWCIAVSTIFVFFIHHWTWKRYKLSNMLCIGLLLCSPFYIGEYILFALFSKTTIGKKIRLLLLINYFFSLLVIFINVFYLPKQKVFSNCLKWSYLLVHQKLIDQAWSAYALNIWMCTSVNFVWYW